MPNVAFYQRLAASWGTLVLLVSVCYGTAMIGSFFTAMGVSDWYPTLQLPRWTPDGQVIGTVWSVLYFMMAIAAWLVWRQVGFAGAIPAFVLFAVQLVLNATWSGLFFAMQSPGAGAIEIWLLLATIVATCVAFWRVSRWGGVLLLPYIGWVSFAGVLNVAIWWLNR
jgi:tryptophan-rich sensory protein